MNYSAIQKLSFLFASIAAAFSVGGFQSVEAAGPENLMLVINGDSASSKLIANHYIALRQIPHSNIVYINGLPAKEATTLEVFREQILKPVLTAIESRGLGDHIDYIVYSSDFPTSIRVNEHLKKLAEAYEERGIGFPRKLYLPTASINTLTYFAAAVLKDQPGYMTQGGNSYYRLPASQMLNRPFIGKAQEVYQQAVVSMQSDGPEKVQEAEKILLLLQKANPRQLAVSYRLTQCYALKKETRKASKWLARSIRLGWQYRQFTRDDPLLANMQDDPIWQGTVISIPDRPFDFAPTIGFRNRYQYGPNGMLNAIPGQGNRYFLSTVLAVTRNYGNTEKEALSQLRQTVAADGSHPAGSFYFTETSDVRTRTRKVNFQSAIDALQELGFRADVVKGRLPSNARAVLGATVGTSQFNWLKSGSRFVPGAIADNLTSFGGRMAFQGQTKLTAFLANGAAGASGTVIEPFALQWKFPHPMIHAHYAKGCTLAEAFYQSVSGPMQLLIVGDALCRPFGDVPDFSVTGVSPDTEVSGRIELKLKNESIAPRIAGYQLYVDGKLIHVQGNELPMRIDTASMSDGHHEIRIVAIANNVIESTSGVVIPIQVNNQNHHVSLKSDAQEYLHTDVIVLTAQSNVGDTIVLVHNGRRIAQLAGRQVEFEIDANLLGRGPVQLEAIAIDSQSVGTGDDTANSVASPPLSLAVDGPISTQKKYENPPRVKTPVITKQPR